MEQGVGRPELISLAAGLVDQESLPNDEIASAFRDLLSRPAQMREALQYGTTPGLAPLRDVVRRRWAVADGLDVENVAIDRVFLGTGSQQILYILAELLLDPGDIVLAGVPTYFVYLGAMRSFGARIVAVKTDENGLDLDDLEQRFRAMDSAGELDRVKFIYDVTYFNNPTGWTLSADRRARLVEIARRWSHRHRILVVDDAAYRELRFRGQDIPSLLMHDPSGQHVVTTGTFSKPFAPGVRTGFGIVPPELVEPLTTQKGHHDFGSASLNQQLLLSLLQTGLYDRHLSRLHEVYTAKLDAFLGILDRELGAEPDVTWTRPEGGLYVWLRLPEPISTDVESDFFTDCLANNVLYVPGRFCFPEGDAPAHYLRLSFGHPPLERCQEGMRRLCRVVKKHLTRTQTPGMANVAE
jgi:2-aminoadipate transaminase